jgi:hypothetical protein
MTHLGYPFSARRKCHNAAVGGGAGLVRSEAAIMIGVLPLVYTAWLLLSFWSAAASVWLASRD